MVFIKKEPKENGVYLVKPFAIGKSFLQWIFSESFVAPDVVCESKTTSIHCLTNTHCIYDFVSG